MEPRTSRISWTFVNHVSFLIFQLFELSHFYFFLQSSVSIFQSKFITYCQELMEELTRCYYQKSVIIKRTFVNFVFSVFKNHLFYVIVKRVITISLIFRLVNRNKYLIYFLVHPFLHKRPAVPALKKKAPQGLWSRFVYQNCCIKFN